MPKYDYKCEVCKESFETIQKMSDAPLKECPSCGGTVYRVVSSNVGISFKGQGFYVNDSQSATIEKGNRKDCSEAAGPCCADCPAKT